jgi:hypothetical protein
MARSIRLAFILVAMCAQWAPVQAQNVYRCGESYSNQPCPGAVVVPTDDPRSAAQRAESRAATQRDTRLADQMQAQRLKREAELARELARERAAVAKVAVPALAPASSGRRPAPQGKFKKPELFTAVAPGKAVAASDQKKPKKRANQDPP